MKLSKPFYCIINILVIERLSLQVENRGLSLALLVFGGCRDSGATRCTAAGL